MSESAGSAYLVRRRDECLAMAEKAADPSIASIHREFASRYDRALSDATMAERPAWTKPVS